jgi:hypothetical protein
MYIRTRTGNVLYDVMLNVKWTAKIDNGLKYYDFDGDYAGLVICENNFKSQGDNLIDVLELDDIIEFNDPRYTNEVYRILSFITSIGNNFDGVKFIDTNDEYSFNEIYLLSLNVKVITHEQYMKLAQEIK